MSPTFYYDVNLRQASVAGLKTPYALASVRQTRV